MSRCWWLRCCVTASGTSVIAAVCCPFAASKVRIVLSLPPVKILAASDVGAVEHTLSLLSFHAERPPSGTGIEMRRLQMVLELHTGENHERYLRTIKAIAVDAERAKRQDQRLGPGRQRMLELPDGSRGVAFRFPGWPDWREVSWSSREDAFVIAIGRGALAARFDVEDTGAPAPWRDHRRAVESTRDDGRTFFNAFLDIDHLRGAFPEAFVEGRTPRMVRARGDSGPLAKSVSEPRDESTYAAAASGWRASRALSAAVSVV